MTAVSRAAGRHVRSLGFAGIASLLAAYPGGLDAQAPSSPPVPQIITTASGEATVVPDRGVIFFAVETRAPTAAAAGAENARRQTAVIAAIRAKGIAQEQITTTGYSVGPDERYDNGQRKVTGYIARNAVVVDVQKIDQIGALIDVALGAGANSIGGLRYYSTKLETARRAALESAVARAKSDADIMARAAGGTLGIPLEISANDAGMPRPMFEVMATGRAAATVETPVSVGEQKVTVSVTTRWTFVPSR